MQKGEAAMNGKHLLLALSLGACSPYEYSKEVAGFSTGIDQLAAAIEGGYANIPTDLANNQAKAGRRKARRKRCAELRLRLRRAFIQIASPSGAEGHNLSGRLSRNSTLSTENVSGDGPTNNLSDRSAG
jgi:hypothetical protein